MRLAYAKGAFLARYGSLSQVCCYALDLEVPHPTFKLGREAHRISRRASHQAAFLALAASRPVLVPVPVRSASGVAILGLCCVTRCAYRLAWAVRMGVVWNVAGSWSGKFGTRTV